MTQISDESNRQNQAADAEDELPLEDSEYCDLCGVYFDGDFHIRDENFPEICDECGEDVELPSIADDMDDTTRPRRS